jgi:dolichyl-phosphate-mannose--protein O-mannosyl transferase
VVCLLAGLLWRDGRALAALSGIIGGYLPWLMYMDRTIFTFYAIAFEPWLILCLTYVFGLAIGPPGADRDRRMAGTVLVTSLLVLIVLISAFFWPLWTGEVIDNSQWRWRIWLPGWS